MHQLIAPGGCCTTRNGERTFHATDQPISHPWPDPMMLRLVNAIPAVRSAEPGKSPPSTGLLVDGGDFPGSAERTAGIAFTNRSIMGSGHGWDIGWSVAWNVRSPFLVVQQPPGAINWCIGCVGKPTNSNTGPNGVFDSTDRMVEPKSL